jgi:hypothetical protein
VKFFIIWSHYGSRNFFNDLNPQNKPLTEQDMAAPILVKSKCPSSLCKKMHCSEMQQRVLGIGNAI